MELKTAIREELNRGTFISTDQLVDVLKSATGAVYQLSTRFPLWDTNEPTRIFVLREELA